MLNSKNITLQQYFNVLEYAKSRIHIKQNLPKQWFNSEKLHDISSIKTVNADLRFSRIKSDIPLIQGKININLDLICQRTLEIFNTNILCDDINLVIINEMAQLDKIKKDTNALILKIDKKLNLADIITEELFNKLPMIIFSPNSTSINEEYFTDNTCNSNENLAQSSVNNLNEKVNPFLLLKNLKL